MKQQHHAGRSSDHLTTGQIDQPQGVVGVSPDGSPSITWSEWQSWPYPRLGDFDLNAPQNGLVEPSWSNNPTRYGRYRLLGDWCECEAVIIERGLGAGISGDPIPSGTFPSGAVLLELPFPQAEHVIGVEDVVTVADGFDGMVVIFPVTGGATISPAETLPAHGALWTPYYAEGYADSSMNTWTSEQRANFRRLVGPNAGSDDVTQGPWLWQNGDTAIPYALDAAYSTYHAWTWHALFQADLSWPLSGL